MSNPPSSMPWFLQSCHDSFKHAIPSSCQGSFTHATVSSCHDPFKHAITIPNLPRLLHVMTPSNLQSPPQTCHDSFMPWLLQACHDFFMPWLLQACHHSFNYAMIPSRHELMSGAMHDSSWLFQWPRVSSFAAMQRLQKKVMLTGKFKVSTYVEWLNMTCMHEILTTILFAAALPSTWNPCHGLKSGRTWPSCVGGCWSEENFSFGPAKKPRA